MLNTRPDTLIQVIDQYPIKIRNKPVVYRLTELQQFITLFQKEESRFVDMGVPADFIALARPLRQELEHREVLWQTRAIDPNLSSQQVKIWIAQGIKLRRQAKAELEVFFRNQDHPIHKLRLSKGSQRILPLIHDLQLLLNLGRNHLTSGNTYPALRASLDQLAMQITHLHNALSLESEIKTQQKQLKLSRDRVNSFAWDYLCTIREFADWIYFKDQETRQKFNSAFYRKHNLKQRKTKLASPKTPVIAKTIDQ